MDFLSQGVPHSSAEEVTTSLRLDAAMIEVLWPVLAESASAR
jgi:hypothetical protein